MYNYILQIKYKMRTCSFIQNKDFPMNQLSAQNGLALDLQN